MLNKLAQQKKTLPVGQKAETSDNNVGFAFKRLHHALRQRMDEALRANGMAMSFAYLPVLFSLYDEPGLTGAQLARRAMVSAQTMNSLLRRLEADGDIERRPHPESRRADAWLLTARGVRRTEQSRAVGDGVFARMLSALNPAEVTRFQDMLSRCSAALEQPGEADNEG